MGTAGGAVTAGASTRTRQRVVNSTGSEGSLERCADVVCTACVTVVASLAWLCVRDTVTEPSTARTAVGAVIGHDPVHGTWTVRYVPDGCPEKFSRVPNPRRSTCLSGSRWSKRPCRKDVRASDSVSCTSTVWSRPSTVTVIR